MDSRVIAVMIIGAGIIALVVSGTIQIPANEIFPPSGWSSGDNVLTAPAAPAAVPARIYILPANRTDGRLGSSDPMACTVAVEHEPELVQPPDRLHCTLIGDSVAGESCRREFVHNCIGDFPSDEDPLVIEDVGNRKRT